MRERRERFEPREEFLKMVGVRDRGGVGVAGVGSGLRLEPREEPVVLFGIRVRVTWCWTPSPS